MSENLIYHEITGPELNQHIRKEFTGIVVFASDWTGGASLVHTMMESMSGHYSPQIRFFSIDPHKFPESAQEFGVNGHLAILLYRNGAAVDKLTGIPSKNLMRSKIDQLLL